jgi:ATPase subunit of ABC transporter with duplicated ATPase domains
VPAASPLRARDLTVTRGPRTVLDAVDLVVSAGQRIGVVGPNGVGKSTLLQALAGEVRLERGRVERTPPTATVGHLPQEASRSDETVHELLARRTGVAAATVELDAATAALANGDAGSDDRYALGLDRWLALGGADLEARVGQVWADLGLAARLLDQPTASLSGGEAARAGLAALFLARFDVFLLDEPTNDLDLAGLDRLERWITELGAGVVLVSHDRTFLARTVTDVLELDEFTHRATPYSGGWQAYLDEREVARRAAWERFDEYDTKRRGLAGRAQREREWATQGLSKAKKSDERDKFIRAFKVDQTEQLAGRAARTEKAIDRLERVDKPREPWQLRLTVGSPGRTGDVVARLDGVVVERGSFTLGPIDLVVATGDRVALVGANGSGKTTLLDAVLGRAELAAGQRSVGPSVVVGEVEQARDRLSGAVTVLRSFQDETGLDAADVRTLLAKFGLVADHVTRAAATLSPGERTRASLALLMANGANVLVLDEPTNHLDLPAIEQLEAALDAFDGTVVLVTHDRSLLDHVRLTRRIELAEGRVVADDVL